jgi:threonine/homoserine/homoserine lactone efflux protein
MTHLSVFVAVSIVVIITPGPDTALTIRNTLAGGRAAGVLTAVGVSSGQAIWALATSAGVAAVLRASELLFVMLKVVGAAYLVYLGIQAIRAAWEVRGSAERATARRHSRKRRPIVALGQGLISNLGNPKMAVFFTSLLPQFVARGGASFAALLVLGILFSLMTLVWLTAYAFMIARAGEILGRPQLRRPIEALTGCVLIALGLRLATEHR